MKYVRFPMYFTVCGYQTIELPDYIDSMDEDAVLEYIDSQWPNIGLPSEYEYVGDDGGVDPDCTVEIFEAGGV